MIQKAFQTAEDYIREDSTDEFYNTIRRQYPKSTPSQDFTLIINTNIGALLDL